MAMITNQNNTIEKEGDTENPMVTIEDRKLHTTFMLHKSDKLFEIFSKWNDEERPIQNDLFSTGRVLMKQFE